MIEQPFSPIDANAFLNTPEDDSSLSTKRLRLKKEEEQKSKKEEKPVENVAPPKLKTYDDYQISLNDNLNPFTKIDSNQWISNADSREAQAEAAIAKMNEGLMSDGAQVPSLIANEKGEKELKMVPANAGGQLTTAGLHALDQAAIMLDQAKDDNNGGFRKNPMTNKTAPVWGSKFMTPYDAAEVVSERDKNTETIEYKTVDNDGKEVKQEYKIQKITPEEVTSEEHIRTVINAVQGSGAGAPDLLANESFNADEFLKYRKSLDDRSFNPDTLAAKTQIEATKDVVFDDFKKEQINRVLGKMKAEKNMPDGKLVDVYEGEPIFNFKNIENLSDFEAQFKALPISAAQKTRYLARFRKEFESSAGQILMSQAEAAKSRDYLATIAPQANVATLMGADIPGLAAENELLKGMEEGKSFYDMLKDNTIDLDRNVLSRFMEKITMSTMNTFRTTGTGAGASLIYGAGKGFSALGAETVGTSLLSGAASIAEAGAIIDESKRSYYEKIGNNEIAEYQGIKITSDDLYDVAGQLIETIATAGLGKALIGTAGKVASRNLTTAAARKIGRESALNIIDDIVAQGGKMSSRKAARINFTEQFKSIWARSESLGKTESLIATSLHGSFSSAGSAISDGYTKGLEEASTKGLVGDAATEYAIDNAMGQGLVNGAATFIAMSVMNSIAPGMEKVLQAPESGLSLATAIRNTVKNSKNVNAISNGLKELVSNESARRVLSREVAKNITKTAQESGVGKYLGGFAASTGSEIIEEMADTALAAAGEAYLLKDEESRKKFENGGIWGELLKSGILGAFGGALGTAASTTPNDKKQMIDRAQSSMDSFVKDYMPTVAQLSMPARVSGATKESPDIVKSLGEILQTGNDQQKAEAIVDIGRQLAGQKSAEIISPEAPPSDVSPEIKPNEIGGSAPQSQDSAPNADVKNKETPPETPALKTFTVSNNTGDTVDVEAPVQTQEELAKNLYEQAHGKTVDAKDVKLASSTDVKTVIGVKPGPKVTVNSYSIDGKDADVHSFKGKNGKMIFSNKANLRSKIQEEYGATAGNINAILDTNEFNGVATEIPAAKGTTTPKPQAPSTQEFKPKAGTEPKPRPDTKPDINPQEKPKAEKKQEVKKTIRDVAGKSEVVNEDKLDDNAKGVVNKAKRILARLKTSVVVYENEQDLIDFGVDSEVIKTLLESGSNAAFVKGKGSERFILVKKNSTDFERSMQHETFHAIERDFVESLNNAELAAKAANEVNNSKDIEAEMVKEYGESYKNQSPANKLGEVVRAFIAGKKIGNTLGLANFQKYLSKFLKKSKQITKNNPSYAEYQRQLEARFDEIVKEDDGLFTLKSDSASFKEWFANLAEKAKGFIPKKKAKAEKALVTKTVSNEVVNEIAERVSTAIVAEKMDNASIAPEQVLQGIVDLVNDELVGVGEALSVESKLAVFDKAVEGWVNKEQLQNVNEVIAKYRQKLNKETTPSIMLDVAAEPAVGESVKEKAKLNPWTKVDRFIRDGSVRNFVEVKQEGVSPINVDQMPFTNAAIDLFPDQSGQFKDLNLKFGDVVEILDIEGNVTGVMIYSHSVTSKDNQGNAVLSHRFMRGETTSNGKATPFAAIRQAQFARDFYEAVTSSNSFVVADASNRTAIVNPKGFIKMIFGTMVGADSQMKFDETFAFVDNANAKSSSPFSYDVTSRKIVVNTKMLEQNFSFIKGDMLSNPQKAESTKMLIASAVRAALEEEVLHHATVGTFNADELVSFTNDLLGNRAFEDIVSQIKSMQSIKTDNENLSDKEKAIIAAEMLSMIHQKSAEGATYADHYDELVNRFLGARNGATATAVDYAQRLKYIMGARMATSYMSPRMQEMVARLKMAKKELGFVKRSTNMAEFVTAYTQEQFNESKDRLQGIIDEAFMTNFQAVNDFREELRSIGVPIRNILFFDWENDQVGLTQNAENYYESQYGKAALDELNQYFSQLNENGAVKELIANIRNSRSRMDNLRESLDYANPMDSMVIAAVDGNFNALIEQIKTAQANKTPISVGALLGVLNDFDFSKNANDGSTEFTRFSAQLTSPEQARISNPLNSITVSNEQAIKEALRNEAVALLRSPETVSEPLLANNAVAYASAVNDYNDLVLNYAEFILNKNLNKVDEFGRNFTPLNAAERISSIVPYQPNMFGYSNQNPIEARAARNARDKKFNELKDNPESLKSTYEWQHAYVGRYVSRDRKGNPDKVVTIDSNAANLGEEEYQRYLMAKLTGEPLMNNDGQQSYEDFYNTMGFNPLRLDINTDGENEPLKLNEYLRKYPIPDVEVTTMMSSDGAIKLGIRKLNSTIIAGMIKNGKYVNSAVEGILNGFFETGDIDAWFSSVEKLIGYNRQTGEHNVVFSLNGRESFASKFANQMKYRLFNNQKTVLTQNGERISNPDPANPSLYEFIQKMREVHYFLNPSKYKDKPGYRKNVSDAEVSDVLARLPDFLEAVDAVNHDIGLARKSYSRFKSQYLKRTILGDIRLIQQQDADGIRANKELRDLIRKSYVDIEGFEDIAWMEGYNDKNGPIGFRGITATQLMNRLVSIPSSAAKEYFVTNTPSQYGKDAIDRFHSLADAFGNPMKKDAVGKSTHDTFNLVFNTLEQPENRPNEYDDEFSDDRPTRAGFGDETAGVMPQGSELTPEQLAASRKADLNEELKKIRSWVLHAGVSVFQSIPELAGDYYSSKIDTQRAKMFFTLFAAVNAEGDSFNSAEYQSARSILNNLLADQTNFLARKYREKNNSISQDFLDILSKIDRYSHPMEYLMDVVSAIAVRERQFIEEQTVSSTLLGDYVSRSLDDAVRKSSDNNKEAAKQILDSIKEDIDNGQLKAGTLFHARSHKLESSEGLLDSAIFAKSPLFSLLIQAMPNLIIYQPNESYTGKSQRVQNDIEFAELANGDAVLFIRNADGLGSAKQSQILEQLLIAQIGKESRDNVGKSPALTAVKSIASQIRSHFQSAIVATPERIEFMTNNVRETLAQSKLAPIADILAQKYKDQLNIEAAEQLSLISKFKYRNDYIKSLFGERNEDMKAFMDNLLVSDPVTNTTSIAEDIRLVVDMFTNPDSYELLGNVRSDERSLVSFALPADREAFVNQAIQTLASREIQSQLVYEYAMDRGEGQDDIDTINSDNFGLNERADINKGFYSVTVDDIYADMETLFIDPDFESEGTAVYNKRMIDGVNAINPARAKMLIDQIMLNASVNSVRPEGGMTFDQVNQAKGLLEAFTNTPDHLYRFAASELIGALDMRKSGAASDSIFTEEYKRSAIASDDAYSLIANSGQFPLLMRSIGRSGSIALGDITNFYYNKTPVTQMFERRRKDLFISAMLSSTDYGKALLDRYKEQANLSDNFTYKVEELDRTPEMLKSIRAGLRSVIGNDIVNEAEANVLRRNAFKDQAIKDAQNQIEEIDARIARLKSDGAEAIMKKLLSDRSLFADNSTIALSTLSNRIAESILSQNLGNQFDAAAIENEIKKGSAIEAFVSYRKNLGKISGIDSKISDLLENEDYLRNDQSGFNRDLGILLKNRSSLRREANNSLQIIADAYTQAMKSNLENSAFALSQNSYASEPSAISEFAEFSLVDRDLLSSIVNDGLRSLTIPVIQAQFLDSDNIAEFRNNLNSTFVGRGLITKGLSREYLKSFDKFVSQENISNLINRYIGSKDIKDAVKAEIESFINDPDFPKSAKELFSRLKKKQQNKALREIIESAQGVYDINRIKAIVSEKLSSNPSVLKQLSDELLYSDLDFVLASRDEATEESGDSIADENDIATGLIAREIERLSDLKDSLIRSTVSFEQDIATKEKATLFRLLRSIRFNENETQMRQMSGLSDSHEIVVNIVLDKEKLNSSPDGQELIRQSELSMAIIQESMRIFIENEGEAMYRHLNEESEVFGENFDITSKMERILEIARFRNEAQSDADALFNAQVEALRESSEDKAMQMFGIGTRDMVTLGLEPAVVEKTESGENVVTANMPKYENDLERMKRVALFINDQYSTSVFAPTTEKLVEDSTKTYMLYDRSAKLELNKIRRHENGSWSVDEALNGIILNAATNKPEKPSTKLKTQSQQDINANLDDEVSDQVKKAAGIEGPMTLRKLISRLKQINVEFFLKETINATLSPLAQGLGVYGTIKPFKRLKDADIEAFFDNYYNYATDGANEPVLQSSGFELLKKAKASYTADQKKELVRNVLEKIAQENKFLDPDSKASHALLQNEALIDDLAMMLNSEDLKKKNINGKYNAIVNSAVDSIAKLYNVEKSIANATVMGPYNLSRAVRDLDLSHNWASLYSVIYGGQLIRDIASGAYNPMNRDSGFAEFAFHQNALLRSKFSMNYGSYLEALNMIGLLDHGVNGFSGRNRYTAEYQDIQDKLGRASDKLKNHYLNGARAYLIASIKGTQAANAKDGNDDGDYARKVWQFFYALQDGLNEHKKLIKNKSLRQRSSNILKRLGRIAYSNIAKQERENEGVLTIEEIAKPFFGAVTRDVNFTKRPRNEVNAIVNSFITALESNVSSSELEAINEYSNALLEQFDDIVNAHRVANTFASQDNRLKMTDDQIGDMAATDIKDVFSRNYSTVPLRFSYVKNPLDVSTQKTDSDSISINEFVSFEQSSLNYKGKRIATTEEAKTKKVLRPIDLNGFTAPDAIANDALYRTYIAPTYMIIRKMMGKIMFDDANRPYTENGFLDDVARIEAGSEGLGNSKHSYVSAYVMSTIEKQIRNDMSQDMMDNAINEYLRFATLYTLGKQLISPWQPVLNGIIPAIGKYLGVRTSKMIGWSDKDTARFNEALAIVAYETLTFKGAKGESAQFVKENSVTSYKHRAEGANVRATQIKRTKFHKENKLKYGTRYLTSLAGDVTEKLLDVTIGAPERIMVQAIYLFELHNFLKEEMGENAPATIKDLFKLNPDEISTLSKTRADIMVTDFMGLGDKSKKAGVYNLDKSNAIMNTVLNGLTRHGNHSATVNANRAAFAQMFFRAKDEVDQKMMNEGKENMIGTFIQNSLFFVVRLPVLVQLGSLFASAIYEWFDEDEPEEDKIENIVDRASEWVRALTKFDEEGNWLANILKEQIFSDYSVFTDEKLNTEEKAPKLLKDLAKQIAADTLGSVPAVGPLYSFLPVQSIIDVNNDAVTRKIVGKGENSNENYMENRRDVEKIGGSIFEAPITPYSSSFDLAALIQNRFFPKEGFDGIDDKEFVYGMSSIIAGTREAKNRVPKRHAEMGGWGYSAMQKEGLKKYLLGEEED